MEHKIAILKIKKSTTQSTLKYQHYFYKKDYVKTQGTNLSLPDSTQHTDK